ncbi:MAG TPA: hypothetical protein VFJ77_02660 [Gaiellaceae bacterium]|nr:hypothetical protein [Gaiellaceae bacterium]
MVVAVVALVALAAALGYSFTATTGVTSVGTITGTNPGSSLIYSATYSAGGLPAAVTNGWKYGTGTNSTTSTSPSWAPIVGQSGTVDTAGDIAFIDATDANATSLLVSLYLTNASDLGGDYSAYAWPIRIYKCTLSSGTCAWSGPITTADGTDTSASYLTNSTAFESVKLDTGADTYYEIAMDAGGMFNTISNSTSSGHSLTPSFYVTATPTS